MRILAIFLFCLASLYVDGQNNIIDLAKKFLKTNDTKNGISEEDIQTSRVSDIYYSEQSGAYFIYLRQQRDGIDIHNAVTVVAIDDNHNIFNSGHHFLPNTSEKTTNRVEALSPENALEEVLKELKVPLPKQKIIFEKKKKNLLSTYSPEIAIGEILAEKIYFPKGECLFLSWRIEIDSKFAADYWSLIVDAENGKILDKYNHTIKCRYDKTQSAHCKMPQNLMTFNPSRPPQRGGVRRGSTQKSSTSVNALHITKKFPLISKKSRSADGAQYLVYPYWVESPNHGDEELLVDPADPLASPFGWHDTNGRGDPETTITRGNNVHAFQDIDDDDESDGDEPDGGPDRIFDFAHDRTLDVLDNVDADVTQVFYMNNIMHDWSYLLGFDENAGNFQLHNLFRAEEDAEDRDHVIVHTLDGLDIGQKDNANFSITSDGRSGRMQLLAFEEKLNPNDLFVLSPDELVGAIVTGSATFGPGTVSTELESKLVLIDDGEGDTTDACESILNMEELTGNIALIRRGTCFFSEKIYNAQQTGAVAAIICNNQPDEVINMDGALNADLVTIPAYFISKENCDPIEQAILNGEEVRVQLIPNEVRHISSGFDNAIVAHEYGHGISGRLTGGPSQATCLNNDEQMGEGWSDFIGLVLTQAPGHEGETPRSIGTYVQGEPITGQGFRRFRYSSDFSINSQTMNDIRGTGSPHPLGEVWAGILWDLYWLFLNEYGYDASWEDESSGNIRALRIVMDGMKLQPCSPGFIAGRDAILEADRLNNDGENQCLIWQAFARRGVGINAVGGSTFERDDNREGYQTLPICIKTLKINRKVREIASAGDIIKVSVTIANHTEKERQEVVVTDEVPGNAEFIDGSSNFPVSKSNESFTFSLGTLASLEEVEITYELRIGIDGGSASFAADNFSTGNNLFVNLVSTGAENEWRTVETLSQFGSNSFNIIDDTLSTSGALTLSSPIVLDAENPVFTFWHQYFTEFAYDGGILQVSEDVGITWAYVPEELFVVNGYEDEMINNQFSLPTRPRAFSGNSPGWVQSFVDLSQFRDSEILIRFLWASNQNVGIPGSLSGWFIDFVEFMDLADIVGTSCVSSLTEPEVCSTASTVLRSSETVSSTNEILKAEYQLQVFPNPTESIVTVGIVLEERSHIALSIWNMAGRTIEKKSYNIGPGHHNLVSVTSHYPDGMYILQLTIDGKVYSQKFVKQE